MEPSTTVSPDVTFDVKNLRMLHGLDTVRVKWNELEVSVGHSVHEKCLKMTNSVVPILFTLLNECNYLGLFPSRIKCWVRQTEVLETERRPFGRMNRT